MEMTIRCRQVLSHQGNAQIRCGGSVLLRPAIGGSPDADTVATPDHLLEFRDLKFDSFPAAPRAAPDSWAPPSRLAGSAGGPRR
ncbi:MAG TPA: hypothetical protein VJ375_15265, partial [Gaiellaceae bacterium]|nr:hypothetical protein [Gaiellaceae bacterium]